MTMELSQRLAFNLILGVLMADVLFIQCLTPELIGQFHIPSPAFSSLYRYSDSNGTTLLVSNFNANPFEADRVFYVEHIEKYVQNTSTPITPSVLTDSAVWPNEISGIPENVFSKRLVAVPGGFLVPFKNKGAITLVDPSLPGPGNVIVISDKGENWFYHRVEWRDMDQDGDLDVLTCRADKPLVGSTKSELLWLENAGALDQSTPWTTHVIAQGPDIFFNEASVSVPSATGNSLSAIFVAQFFTSALRVFWVENTGNWSQTEQIHSRTIDSSVGALFDVQVCDVNADSRLDLLVTTNSPTNGSLWVYEIPDDFRTGQYRRHLLAYGFKSSTGGTGKGAPGKAILVQPANRAAGSAKPYIVLSGDDEGKAFLVAPTSQDPNDWRYLVTSFLDIGRGTVGEIAVADLDQDGRLEMFVPAYSTSTISAPRSKPRIVLSGAKEGTAYLLSPQSPGKKDWRYTAIPMLDMAPGLVGKPALGDVNGDGRLEMFLSAFNRDTVFVYRLQ